MYSPILAGREPGNAPVGAASEVVPAISVEACPVPPALVVNSAGAYGFSSTVMVVVAVERSGQSFPPIKANDVKSFIFMVPKSPPRRSAGRIFGRGQFAGRGSTATRDGPATVIENAVGIG